MTVIEKPVIFQWAVSSFFGWGVYGVNLMLNWQTTQDELLVTSAPVSNPELDLNTIERRRIQYPLQRSEQLQQQQIRPYANGPLQIDIPVLHALGNDIIPAALSAYQVQLLGAPSLGMIFSESTAFTAEGHERAKLYPLIVAGSTWNSQTLANAGIGPSTVVLQGVDPTHFHSSPSASQPIKFRAHQSDTI